MKYTTTLLLFLASVISVCGYTHQERRDMVDEIQLITDEEIRNMGLTDSQYRIIFSYAAHSYGLDVFVGGSITVHSTPQDIFISFWRGMGSVGQQACKDAGFRVINVYLRGERYTYRL